VNTITIPNNEALDHALVQCLRLFAQHGHKIRSQKLPSDEKLSAAVLIKKESKLPDNKETGQKRTGSITNTDFPQSSHKFCDVKNAIWVKQN
jgi:hypothetical protein